MYFTIPDRRALPRDTPERRKDHVTRLLVELRNTELGLMFYQTLRPEDTRVNALLLRCEAEIAHYTCTIESETI